MVARPNLSSLLLLLLPPKYYLNIDAIMTFIFEIETFYDHLLYIKYKYIRMSIRFFQLLCNFALTTFSQLNFPLLPKLFTKLVSLLSREGIKLNYTTACALFALLIYIFSAYLNSMQAFRPNLLSPIL